MECDPQEGQPVEKLLQLHGPRHKERATALNTNSQLAAVPECSTAQGETDMAACAGKG